MRALQAHGDEVGRLHDALGRGPHPPALHVEGDAEVLADDHAVGDDLDAAATVGQQLGNRRRLVEAQLVDDHHVPERVSRAVDHVADVADVGRLRRHPPRPVRFGARGHDHVVGAALLDETRPHGDAVLDGDAQPPALG